MKYFTCSHDIYGDYQQRAEYFEIDDDGYVARLVYIFPDAVVTSRDDHDPLVPCTFIEHPIHDWDQ